MSDSSSHGGFQGNSGKVLASMLERLFASIAGGPGLNCRPHNSRQRLDWTRLAKLQDSDPTSLLRVLLGDAASFRVHAKVPQPPDIDESEASEVELEAFRELKRQWAEQSGLLSKLRLIVEEARTYEEDTGVWVLNLGFPLLSLPPSSMGTASGTRRVLAPIAYIPILMSVKTGAGACVDVECHADEIDRVFPNEALLAWLEQQTGERFSELFADERGENPWREISECVRAVANKLKVPVPDAFMSDITPDAFNLENAPTAEEAGETPRIVSAAVLGLFPMANESLLRDTQMLADEPSLEGPIGVFTRGDRRLSDLDAGQSVSRHPADDRLVTTSDPCQARAVAAAKTCAGLVIHGPPGTGKSQTITNIIGDHLIRGERVLFVCEKRTALDVVANRLEGLGLGSLCAVVHDPQRDQKDLYMGIRNQLEQLPELKTRAVAEQDVVRSSLEIRGIFEDLCATHASLMQSKSGSATFTDLVGEWLHGHADDVDVSAYSKELQKITPADFDRFHVTIMSLYMRAQACELAVNPWVQARKPSLAMFLAAPMDDHRKAIDKCAEAARDFDAWRSDAVPPFDASIDVNIQAAERAILAEAFSAAAHVEDSYRALWSKKDRAWRSKAADVIESLRMSSDSLAASTLDRDLWAVLQASQPKLGDIARHMSDLESYLSVSRKWWSFLAFGTKKLAAQALSPLGLKVSSENADRAYAIYAAARAIITMTSTFDSLEGCSTPGSVDQAHALKRFASHDALSKLFKSPSGGVSSESISRALDSAEGTSKFVDGLRQSDGVARRIATLEANCAASGLLCDDWLKKRRSLWRGGASCHALFEGLRSRITQVENVLRCAEEAASLPKPIAEATLHLASRHHEFEVAHRVMRRVVLGGEISKRVESDPVLRRVDGKRIDSLIARMTKLESDRRAAIKDSILHRWAEVHRERFLSGTGSRMNNVGASVKQRLTTRGKNALRLRRVLELGRTDPQGDPLLDLRPVWMASPETVAQLFARLPIFDVVIFDEASQLRLEEALPVLTRARRFVIAGDPKQLPPTRFFESAVAQSEAVEIETEEQLFEVQQSQTEDLLSAALGLDIEQSYLDVHYRSKNPELIEFSNEHFYDSRLQAIPTHPGKVASTPAIRLVTAEGRYEKRVNEIEARRVCEIIKELLAAPKPPSIGVGCFNIAQRDLISEILDEMSAVDSQFATRLAAARELRNRGAFEGLFVKNLENVQGDERDHIIISTTYGPDANGTFYKRFGPLAMPGGGRRLNVLVTRAREAVHLVTSIPRESYIAIPPVPAGQSPGGGYLLMAYLKYADELRNEYKKIENAIGAAEEGHPEAERVVASPGKVIAGTAKSSSNLAAATAGAISHRHGRGSIVHWGNDGFSVDVALRDPERIAGVTSGVLCDWTRFAGAEYPVEWDIFRSGVLAQQGWSLQRIWSPQVFRDFTTIIDGLIETDKAFHSTARE